MVQLGWPQHGPVAFIHLHPVSPLSLAPDTVSCGTPFPTGLSERPPTKEATNVTRASLPAARAFLPVARSYERHNGPRTSSPTTHLRPSARLSIGSGLFSGMLRPGTYGRRVRAFGLLLFRPRNPKKKKMWEVQVLEIPSRPCTVSANLYARIRFGAPRTPYINSLKSISLLLSSNYLHDFTCI